MELFLIAFLIFAPASNAAQSSGSCTPSGQLVQLPGLSEASGLAASRSVPGRLWSHNDSGQPILFALDSRGGVSGQIGITGATVEDWEGLAVGPCGNRSCLYIGDIGDNNANRKRVTVYRLAEPEQASGTAAVSEVFHGTYPDGAQDAEALIAANGRLYIVTKGETGPVAIYGFPAKLEAGSTMKLERVAEISPKADAQSRITDASASPDGRWVVLRSRSTLFFYRAAELFGGKARAASTVDVRPLKEPQGEGVAYAGDGTVFLASEGGGKALPGTFVRFSCALPGD
jgi:hypothetical protein